MVSNILLQGWNWDPQPIVPGLPDKGLSKCLEKIRCPVDKQQAPAVSAGSLPAVINGEVFKAGSADATERAGADAVIGSGEGIPRCLMIPHSAAAFLKTVSSQRKILYQPQRLTFPGLFCCCRFFFFFPPLKHGNIH